MAYPRFAAGLVLWLSACSAPGATTESETETETGADVPEGCECIIDETSEASGPWWPTCGEELCDIVNFESSESGDFILMNPEALDCALMALRDRSPGVVRWSWNREYGQYTDIGYVLVHPEGTAARRSWGAQDLSWTMDDALAGELPSAQHYDDCLADSSPAVRFGCLANTSIPNATVCAYGWTRSNLNSTTPVHPPR